MREFGRIIPVLFLAVVMAGCVTLPSGKSSSSGQQCDLSKPETTPLSRFRIDEIAGTVFDTQTNLTWKRCAEGQTYKSGACEGDAVTWKWDDVVAKFGVDGSSWRMPNVDELDSIVEKRCKPPAVNLHVFRNTSPDWFWSGSPHANSSLNAWGVGFGNGGAGSNDRSYLFQVRLVRGGQWFDPSGILHRERKEAEEKMARIAENERQREIIEAADVRQREIQQRQAEEEKRRKQEELKAKIVDLVEAEKSAVVYCPDKTVCDKVFSLTQIYLNQTADMKIQVATDTIVETYNPTEDGKLGLKAIRIPGKGSSAAITLTATCKDEKGFYVESCRLGKIRAYKGFRPFVEQMLKN